MANAVSADETIQPARSWRRARIRSLSRIMAALCTCTSAILAGAMLFSWLTTPGESLMAQAGIGGAALGEPGYGLRIIGFLISMLPLGALIVGLSCARRCFDAFASGEVFSGEAVGWFRRFSIAVVVSAIMKPVAGVALSLLLSWGVGTEHMSLVLNIGSDTLLALIFGGTVAVMTWVMSEAIAIADENAQFV